MVMICLFIDEIYDTLRKGFINLSHGNLPSGGYSSPPFTDSPLSKTEFLFAENDVFRPKNTVFGPIFNGFFLNGKGGYSPPLHGRPVPKNLTEKS